jgi:hypothetical protein
MNQHINDPEFDAAVKSIKNPVFFELVTKPRPSVAERRRKVPEMLANEEAELARLDRIAADYTAMRAKREFIDRLRKAIDYLGAPDARLDLYRTFAMPLPPPHDPLPRLPVHRGEVREAWKAAKASRDEDQKRRKP